MSHPTRDPPFPRGALLGATGLVVLTLVAGGTARLTGIGVVRQPPVAAAESRELRFADRADGAVLVYDATDEKRVQVLESGTNGFVRGVMRGLARDRKRQDIDPEIAFRLFLGVDGRLAIEDPATGRRIDIDAFGPTNRDAFARLLTAGSETR